MSEQDQQSGGNWIMGCSGWAILILVAAAILLLVAKTLGFVWALAGFILQAIVFLILILMGIALISWLAGKSRRKE